jgi:hypothetical protein
MPTPRRLDAARLFALGFLTLFLELVLIRYLAGSIWNLGYFPNLVLMAAFFGLGMGFVLHQLVPSRLSSWILAGGILVLVLLVAYIRVEPPRVPGFTGPQGELGEELFFSAEASGAGGGLAVFVMCFLAIVTAFASIAQCTAKVFRRFPPLVAYTLDIGGSCAGIVSFMAVSWLELPAWAWFLMLVPMAAASLETRRPRLVVTGLLAVAAAVAASQDTQLSADPRFRGKHEVHWSPYQKVELADWGPSIKTIFVNGIAHQSMYPKAKVLRGLYEEPHRLRRDLGQPPFRDVLILGAGSGNDVVAALAYGATHVDAVEIDPVIARLGKRYHHARPYQDPRVKLTVDDGRAFMTRSSRRYDLVVFALTDSLVKVSPVAQLRLENYLFTREAVERAWGLLKDGGLLVFYNDYRREWLVEKIERMAAVATGLQPRRYASADGHSAMVVVGHALPEAAAAQGAAGVEISTDDWPFLYLRERGIPAMYLYAMAVLGGFVLLLLLLLRGAAPEAGTLRMRSTSAAKLAFLLMGVAFLLLETKSVIQFSLLFGTTWYNNSLVFLGILLLVLAANWLVQLAGRIDVFVPAFVLLVATCVLAWMVPLGSLLAIESFWGRFALASLLTFSPIFFANLLFSSVFRDQEVPEHLFGWNLLGATLGGIVEYSSMALGYHALAILVAICYAAAFLLLRADRRIRTLPEAVLARG